MSLSERKPIGKVFPNLNSTIAYYNPSTFYINLNTISEQEYSNIVLNADHDNAHNLSIFAHELRHYIDHIATLWGQKHILKLFKAVNAKILNDENGLSDILPFKIAENQFHYDSYYTYEFNKGIWQSYSDNWKWELTCGYKFDLKGNIDKSRPLMFIRFSTPNGKPLIRVPLSIAALLETSATMEELTIRTQYINKLAENYKTIELRMFSDELFKNTIYNQDMAIYNSIVHLTASTLELSNILDAINISSALATLTLNLPTVCINRIPIAPEAIKDWNDRANRMMVNHEYSFIFYNLLTNYKNSFLKNKRYKLEEVLLSNQLPDLTDLNKLLNEEFLAISREVNSKENFKKDFTSILNEGKRIFDIRGIDGTNFKALEIFENHNLKPRVICSDTDFDLKEYKLDKIPSVIDDLKPQEWDSFIYMIDPTLEDFFSIRGL